MYCDAPDSPRRRATQAAMHEIFDALCRLLAPILAFTAGGGVADILASRWRLESILQEFPRRRIAGQQAIDQVAGVIEIARHHRSGD